MESYYVQVINEEVQPLLLHKNDIFTILNNTHTVVPTDLDESVLNFLGFYKADIILTKSQELENIPTQYLTRTDNIIFQSFKLDNTYIIKMQGVLDLAKIEYEWVNIRKFRDEKLQKFDWVENSIYVSDSDKQKVLAYKNYLRNIPIYYKYPCDVIWIDEPTIAININKDNDLLSEEEIEKIKNYNPSNLTEWNTFLLRWYFTNLNPYKQLVKDLLGIYTGITLDEIIN